MFAYYLRLSLKSIKTTPVLSVLIVTTLGFGIAACTIVMTMMHSMSADPIAHKSESIYRVQLDNWGPNKPAIEPNEPPEQVTWNDAHNLLQSGPQYKQTASSISWGMVEPEDNNIVPFLAIMRPTFSNFFSIFDTPFLYGGGWDRSNDIQPEHLVVLSKQTNERVFKGLNSVGKTIRMLATDFTVVGVLDDWHPSPKFYDMSYGAFSDPEDIYLPLGLKKTLQLPHGGINECWQPIEGDHYDAFLQSECVNFQFWVELANDEEKQSYRAFLDHYVEQQRALGRFPRPNNNRLMNVKQWLDYKQVVGSDIHVLMGLSLLFLLVCIINATSLLAAKFSNKSAEIVLRRALGASRKQLFYQQLTETLSFGVLGGLMGLLLSLVCLQGLPMLHSEFSRLTQLDLNMAIFSLSLALTASFLAGLPPIWQANRISPAIGLKQHDI